MRRSVVGSLAVLAFLLLVTLSALAQAATRGPDPSWSGPLTSATSAGLACNINTINSCLPFENNASVNRSRAPIMNLSNFTNAHAEILLPPITQYDKTLCCWGLPALTGFCNLTGTSKPVNTSGDPDVHDAVVLLSNNTNAHVEEYPLSVQGGGTTQNYNVNACIGVGRAPSTAGNTIISDCQYATSCGSLGTGYTCVATISNATNAHVANRVGGCADPADYSTKVCCKVVSDDTAPAPTRVAPSVACGSLVQQDGHFTFVNYSDSGVGPLSACELEWAEAGGVYRIDMAVGGTAGSGTPVGGTEHYCFYNQTNIPTSRFGSSYYWYRVRMEDKFTNFQWSSNCTLQFKFDLTPPNSSVTVPNASASPYNDTRWSVGGAVKGVATDDTGAQGVEVRISRGPLSDRWWWTGSTWSQTLTWLTATVTSPGATSTGWSYSWTPDQDYTDLNITSRATDTASNVQTDTYDSLFIYDATPPITTLNYHPPTSNPKPDFTGSSTDSTTDVAFIQYAIKNLGSGNQICNTTIDPWINIAVNPSYAFTSCYLNPGLYNITVRSIDSAQNTEHTAWQLLQIQGNPPNSQIQAPSLNGTPYNASAWNSSAIWGTANDDVGVQTVGVRIKRQSDGWFWNGASWQSTEQWNTAQLSNSGAPSTAFNFTWNTTQDGFYNLSSLAVDTGGTQETPNPLIIAYDTVAPEIRLSTPLPVWTNTTAWYVGWTGSDAVSGINMTWLDYRVNGSGWGQGQWKNSSAPTSWQFGPTDPVMVKDATNYGFRLRSRDLAGNERSNGSNGEWNTTTDLTKPACSLGSVPFWSNNPFNVTWTTSDTGSGVNYTNATYSTDKSTWLGFGGLAGCAVNATGAYGCYGTDSVTYFFKCSAIDYAGNNGTDSAIKNTTIDTTAPVSSIRQLPQWSKSTQLNISWSGSDNGGSGIACFGAQWNKTAGPQNFTRDGSVCLNTSKQWELFGPSSPTTVSDGDSFGFRVKANDSVGNSEAWPAAGDAGRTTNTTIDTGVPSLFLRAVDQNGQEIGGVVAGSGVSKVTMIANATDAASGLAGNLIEYWVTQGNIQSYSTKECGSAAGGAWSNCSVTVDYAPATQLKYRATATDRAGNVNASGFRFVVTHPLANFVTHDLFLTLGSSFIADVQVRNLLNYPTNVTVNLTGYALAGFLASGSGGNSSILAGGRVLIAQAMGPQEERTYHVELVSTDPQSYTPGLNLTANNSASGADFVTDRDGMSVVVGFPASFSGLNAWAVALLVLAAAAIYLLVGRQALPAQHRRSGAARRHQ